MRAFRRRIYSVPAFIRDVFAVLVRPYLAVGTLWGRRLDARFRERLSLAVISVNRCRYCTYIHTRAALSAGIADDDVGRFLAGDLEDVPAEEAKAVSYAQHWADADANPDPAVRAELIGAYGAEHSKAIEMMLRLVRIGSLTGNSFDYVLSRISRGRWGLTEADAG